VEAGRAYEGACIVAKQSATSRRNGTLASAGHHSRIVETISPRSSPLRQRSKILASRRYSRAPAVDAVLASEAHDYGNGTRRVFCRESVAANLRHTDYRGVSNTTAE
jgi:hypothetical protein